MLERKKVIKTKKFRCSWKIGDTFAFELSGIEAQMLGLSGHYMLFRKVDEFEFGDGHLLPILTLTHWEELPFPQNSDAFKQAPVLKLSRGRLGMPLSKYEYRAELIIRSVQQLNSLPLEYIGNFSNVQMPEDEVVVRHAGKVLMISPEYLERDCCAFWKHHCYYMTGIGN